MTMTSSRFTGVALGAALVLAAGLAAGGALAGAGFARLRTADRTVSVKGVAEREAKADLAIWPLRLVATDDDLGRANAALERNVQQVREFLRTNGLDSSAAEITVRPLVHDSTSLAMPLLGLFAIATLAQTQLPRLAASNAGMRLFVHARNGFYINTLANRVTAAVWPPQAAKENA